VDIVKKMNSENEKVDLAKAKGFSKDEVLPEMGWGGVRGRPITFEENK